ncbi:MAG: ABC transporter permease, partial [Bacteroidota bacterium]|nr:ABC transporter permease [Bacteroidota bacterium]
NSFPKIKGKSILGSPFAFPDVWQTISWNSSLLLLIPAVLIITLTTNEFTYRTHRQNIIDGLSRSQFINIKLFEVLLLSIFITLIVVATTLGFGYLSNPVPSNISVSEHSRFATFFFIEMISYSMIAFLLSMLIKRAGLAMGAFFIYMIIEQFIVALLRNKYHITSVDYLPQEVTDLLIPQPYLAKAFQTDVWLKNWRNHLPVYLAFSGFYLFLYCFISSWRFRKSDL